MHAHVDADVPFQRRTFALPERHRDWAVCVGFVLGGLLLIGLATYVEAGGSEMQGAIRTAAENQSQPSLFTGAP